MKKPKLSVLITSYKNAPLLKLCINSFKENLTDLSYEIIVADSETEEDVRDLMREDFPKIKFIANKKNVGYGFLFNQLLKKAQGDFYFVVNADIIIKDNAVQKLIKYLEENPKVGVVGPKLINFDNSIQASFFRFYRITTIIYRRTFIKKMPWAKRELDRFLMKNVKKTKPFECDWIMGSALMMKSETAKKIGFMDSRFFMYFEDVDWCWRVWEKGLKVVYNPLVKVYHYHGKASANRGILRAVLFNKYARIHIESAIKFFWKHKTLGWKKPY
jgi:GT2 family glycosyltransferase